VSQRPESGSPRRAPRRAEAPANPDGHRAQSSPAGFRRRAAARAASARRTQTGS
jgi:hypothetical protein